MQLLNIFWRWYEKHLVLNTRITAILFILQIAHLFWLGFDVVAFKLTGQSYFPVNYFTRLSLILVDYTEIPAIISATILYFQEIRTKRNLKAFLFIILLNSQWLHLFWITDEFVIAGLTNVSGSVTSWLAWIAIGIDYLEIPIIIDTIKKSILSIRRKT